jgi:hypothetical protein
MSENKKPAKAKVTDPLILAAQRVWKAYLAYGPVDDGRREGKMFEAALDKLMKAAVEAKYRTAGVSPKMEKRLSDAWAVLEAALELLVDIRYRTWPKLYDENGQPVDGLGIGLTPQRLDDVLIEADRLAKPRPKK